MYRRWITLSFSLFLAAVWLLPVVAASRAQAPLPPGAFAGPCSAWVPVNDPAFGLGPGDDGSHAFEEGFEVAIFEDQLYVGMEADNALGARLWRTRPGIPIPTQQNHWEEASANDAGEAFDNPSREQNDHIDSLAAFDGFLYASTANRSGYQLGTMVYRSSSGGSGSWTPVITPGFGDPNNQNFKDMTPFTTAGTRWLCGGTSNAATGAQIWCTADGTTWEQRNASGFGAAENGLIASTAVFSGALYVGVANETGGGSLWRSADLLAWTQVFTADRPRVEVAGAFGGQIYIVAGADDGRNPDDPTLRLYRSPSGAPGSWEEVGTALSNDPHNTRTVVDGAAVYNGALYLATMNALTGAEVWRTVDGLTWTQVNADGFGQPTTFAAQLATFNGYLYAWTSDYVEGQRVYRTACSICAGAPVTGTGRYAFPAVGATITLTTGAPEAITVCVRPEAFPTAQIHAQPVARTYALSVAPPEAAFTADVALSYTEAEHAAGDLVSTTQPYLSRWNGTAWKRCPPENRDYISTTRTVICRDAAHATTWAIAGEGGAPTRVGIAGAARATALPPLIHLVLIALLLGTLTAGRRKRKEKRFYANLWVDQPYLDADALYDEPHPDFGEGQSSYLCDL